MRVETLLTRIFPLRLLLAATLTVFVPALILIDNVHSLDRSDDWAVHNYAVDVLSQPLEPEAAVVGILGEVTLLRYYQETQGLRREVETVAADSDALRMDAVNRLVATGRPVYLTRPLAGLEKTHTLRSVGPLVRVSRVPAGASDLQQGGVASQAVFAGRIALLSYRLAGLAPAMHGQSWPQMERNGAVEAGGRLRLTLLWQALQPVQQSYRLTIRLKTPTNRLLWQSDAGPVHDSYPTSAWRTGETVADVHDLLVPLGTPPGLYDLEIGFYDPANLQLLPVAGRPGLLTIGPVSVVRPESPIDLDSLPLRSPAAPAGLSIPGSRFDYSLERLGIQHVLRANLQNEFTLYGYGVPAASLVPGQTVDVTLLWQAARPPSGDRVVFVQLVDKNNGVWASHESQPGDGSYSTRQWARDEVIRDLHTLLLPADIPDGAYRLEAGMYDPSGTPLTVLRLTRRSLDRVALGTVEVRGRQRSQEIPAGIQYTVNAAIGKVAKLAGYDVGVGDLRRGADQAILTARPGETVSLRLVWQAMEPTGTSYTVFAHLLGPDGQVVSQDDSVPGRGTLPTTSWLRGEVLLDMYTLAIPANAAAGLYQIELGLYEAVTGSRLPVWDESGASVGDSLMLTKVRIERAP